jgi:hypothetical protein
MKMLRRVERNSDSWVLSIEFFTILDVAAHDELEEKKQATKQ